MGKLKIGIDLNNARLSSSKGIFDDGVNEFLSVSPVSASLEGVSFGSESSSGGSKFEGPDEVVGLLEVGSAGDDFVDQVLNTDDSVFSKALLDDRVVFEWDSLSVDLAESSLVQQFSDVFSGGISKA